MRPGAAPERVLATVAKPTSGRVSLMGFDDSRLSEKLSETSAPRVTLDRAIGSADKLAGSLLIALGFLFAARATPLFAQNAAPSGTGE